MGKIIFFARVTLVIILLLVCISCPRFKRNPNLRLLLSEENYSLLNPRWTKDRWIYYVKCEETGDYVEYGIGEVWRIKDNGENKELIFPDSVAIMDISPSETLLVVAYSNLILFNIGTAQTETLTTASPPNHFGLRFGFSDTFIYYLANDGIHRINIYTRNDTTIIGGVIYYFDTYRDSLIYFNQKILDIYTSTLVYESPDLIKGFFTQSRDTLLLVAERKDGLQMYDIKTGKKVKLDAKIEEITVWAELGNCIDFDPSGKQIVFCATDDVMEDGDAGPFELWILEEF
ncbi:MAG: hypothetical protein ABIL22_04875 [candidate division WOR-3 bacterium]